MIMENITKADLLEAVTEGVRRAVVAVLQGEAQAHGGAPLLPDPTPEEIFAIERELARRGVPGFASCT
jgi:hypothetical protein